MNEFLYNFAWWVYTILMFFSVILSIACFHCLLEGNIESAKIRGIVFIIVFFITLTMLSARTQFLNWIGGGL